MSVSNANVVSPLRMLLAYCFNENEGMPRRLAAIESICEKCPRYLIIEINAGEEAKAGQRGVKYLIYRGEPKAIHRIMRLEFICGSHYIDTADEIDDIYFEIKI